MPKTRQSFIPDSRKCCPAVIRASVVNCHDQVDEVGDSFDRALYVSLLVVNGNNYSHALVAIHCCPLGSSFISSNRLYSSAGRGAKPEVRRTNYVGLYARA